MQLLALAVRGETIRTVFILAMGFVCLSVVVWKLTRLNAESLR